MQTVVSPVVSTVACNPLVSTVTSPVVGALQGVQDSTGLASLPLVYETNYPAMIGADTLHCRGITGRGVTIAVLDTGLWHDTFQNYGESHPRDGRRDERRPRPGERATRTVTART